MRKLIFILIAFTFILTGCAVPFPHVKTICGPVSGNIVDLHTGKPVTHAYIWATYPDNEIARTNTDSQGNFCFGKHKKFRRSVMIGATDSMRIDTYSIRIDAQGYIPVRIIFPYGNSRPSWDHYVHIQPPVESNPDKKQWHWPKIKLQRSFP